VTSPRRVRVQGDLFHGQVPDGAVYVGRGAPGLRASLYSNPFRESTHGLPEASRLYLEHLASRRDLLERAQRELAGRDLACWCPLPAAGEPDLCHAAVLLDVANFKVSVTGTRLKGACLVGEL
jgi:Domain of unknown function (DUF4326)